MAKGSNNTYWGNILEGFISTLEGARLTFSHLANAFSKKRRTDISVQNPEYFTQDFGLETLQFPKEQLPVPDNGRYQLHNEIDDCIVCDKCAKICPVNCIEIETIKSPEVIGETSDGTAKRLYAATFNIDMAKCCFCGLCTTVCPTECLTMTEKFDFSEFDVRKMTYEFAELTPEEAKETQEAYEHFLKEKETQKASATTPSATSEAASLPQDKNTDPQAKPAPARPYIPRMKPPVNKPSDPPTPSE